MNSVCLSCIRLRFSSYKILSNYKYYFGLHFSIANDIIQKCSNRKELYNSDQFGHVYVRNKDVADSIASCIAQEWNGGYLLEANAGPGILSSSLLKSGIQHLRVFEKNKEFLTALEVLSTECPSLEIVQQDLMLLPSLEFRKRSEPTNPSAYVKEFYELTFKDIPEYPWENGTSFQIFSVIASKKSHKFLRFLLAALPNRSTLFSFGRCDFFFLVTETEYMCMKALPKENLSMYRWSTVLYNLFFEIKCLQKFSSNSKNFLFCVKSSKKIARAEYFYLIKLTPKTELYSPTMSQEKLQDLFYFVRSHLAKRSDLVIKSIEQWIPFCGPRLIKEGMNVFMKFGDLSPSEILWLFNNLSSWPEYQNCNLRAFAHKFNRKKFIEDDNLNE